MDSALLRLFLGEFGDPNCSLADAFQDTLYQNSTLALLNLEGERDPPTTHKHSHSQTHSLTFSYTLYTHVYKYIHTHTLHTHSVLTFSYTHIYIYMCVCLYSHTCIHILYTHTLIICII